MGNGPGHESASGQSPPRVNLLVIKLNNLGDNVVFVPAVQALRQNLPKWKITLLTTPIGAELYAGPLGPQEIVVCRKALFEGSYRKPWVLARWIWLLRSKRPDACIVSFDQGNAAHAAAKFSGAKVRIGGNAGHVLLGRTLTEVVPFPEDGRPVTWNWEMARAMVRAFDRGQSFPLQPPAPDLRHLLSPIPRERPARRRIVVHAGAGGTLNQWGEKRFASVAKSLSGEHEVIWITHGGVGAAPDGTIAAAPETLSDLSEYLASADLYLGNNSGPMHLANALGREGVCVSGPSATGWDPYWHPERWTVLRHPNLYCAPCERIDRRVPACANIQNPMACLDFWTPEMVLRACRERLDRNGGTQR
jgi:ADP-heptose:LPS heptosyltransferase